MGRQSAEARAAVHGRCEQELKPDVCERMNKGLLLPKKASQVFLPEFSSLFRVLSRGSAKICLLGETVGENRDNSAGGRGAAVVGRPQSHIAQST